MFVVGGFGILFLVIMALWLAGIASLALGIAALISVSQTPQEAFGPWWDNTRQTWIIGIAVSFLIPFGHLITGIMWFTSGRPATRDGRTPAGRPFWAGPPRPQPVTQPGFHYASPPPSMPPPPYAPPPPAPGP